MGYGEKGGYGGDIGATQTLTLPPLALGAAPDNATRAQVRPAIEVCVCCWCIHTCKNSSTSHMSMLGISLMGSRVQALANLQHDLDNVTGYHLRVGAVTSKLLLNTLSDNGLHSYRLREIRP